MRDGSPGPGGYDDRDYNHELGHGVSYTIPKNEKELPGEPNPGPGHYKIPVKFADVPRYVLPEQNEEFKWV